MNSAHRLSAGNMLRTLPEVLQSDASTAALAASTADILEQHIEEIKRLCIYARIDELPEELLDLLAYDFKVDWWDADYSVEEKRRTLKGSWQVHRMLGTKAAVETAISAIYPDTHVQEWFEYGGNPYHFKLQIDARFENVSPEKHRRVLKLTSYYKNLRSHLDAVEYTINTQAIASIRVGAAVPAVCIRFCATAHAYKMVIDRVGVTAHTRPAYTGVVRGAMKFTITSEVRASDME